MLNISFYLSCVNIMCCWYPMLLSLTFVRYLYVILKLKHEALTGQKRLISHNQTSLQHRLQNRLNIEYFTCDILWCCICEWIRKLVCKRIWMNAVTSVCMARSYATVVVVFCASLSSSVIDFYHVLLTVSPRCVHLKRVYDCIEWTYNYIFSVVGIVVLSLWSGETTSWLLCCLHTSDCSFCIFSKSLIFSLYCIPENIRFFLI